MTNITKQYPQLGGTWSTKQLGAKPSEADLTTAHAFGRPGKQSLALAMAMRPEGVTGAQIVMACGAPQNNHRRGVLASGYFKRDNAVAANDLGHTVYKITLTPKGEAAIKRRAEAAEKAALKGDAPKVKKAKGNGGKRKPRAKVAPAAPAAVTEAPAGEAPAGDAAQG